MENNSINIYLGEKTCDERMIENIIGINNEKEKEKGIINESSYTNENMAEWLYMQRGLEDRNELLEHGMNVECYGRIVLKEWVVKDEGRKFNEDLYRVKKEKLDESKLEKIGNGLGLYNGNIDKDDLLLVRKGDGLRIKRNEVKIDESFGDVFDSSLVDYSGDFEQQDSKYKTIQDIKNFMKHHLNGCEYNFKNPNDNGGIRYVINDDLSIDVLKTYPLLLEIDPLDYGDTPELPDYINFNVVYGNFAWNCGECPINGSKGFPKIVYDGDIYNSLLRRYENQLYDVSINHKNGKQGLKEHIQKGNNWFNINYEFFDDSSDDNTTKFYYASYLSMNDVNKIMDKFDNNRRKCLHEGLCEDNKYVPFGQCYLNKYLQQFKDKSGIKNLSGEEMASTLNSMGLNPTKENPQLYYKSDVEKYLYNKINEFKNNVLNLRLMKTANNNIVPTVVVNNKSKSITPKRKTLEDRIGNQYVKAEEKKRLEKIERDEEMKRVSQELIDKDNYKDDIDESFTDVFDSSLVDYSGDFEQQDFKYKKINLINEYMHTYTNAILEDELNDGDKGVKIKSTRQCKRFNMGDRRSNPMYRINDDFSVDIIFPDDIKHFNHYKIFKMYIKSWPSLKEYFGIENIPVINKVDGNFEGYGYMIEDENTHPNSTAVPSSDTIIHCFPKKIYGNIYWNNLESLPPSYTNDEVVERQYSVNKQVGENIKKEYFVLTMDENTHEHYYEVKSKN